jgi:hypothetical protein
VFKYAFQQGVKKTLKKLQGQSSNEEAYNYGIIIAIITCG